MPYYNRHGHWSDEDLAKQIERQDRIRRMHQLNYEDAVVMLTELRTEKNEREYRRRQQGPASSNKI